MRLVDADELLEILRIMQEVYFDRKIILGKVVEEVKRMPTIKPEPKWIPCDMQLPEKTQLCLVTEKTVVGFEVHTRCFNKRDDGGFWSGWGHTDVIAWMPLPEPWRGEES